MQNKHHRPVRLNELRGLIKELIAPPRYQDSRSPFKAESMLNMIHNAVNMCSYLQKGFPHSVYIN